MAYAVAFCVGRVGIGMSDMNEKLLSLVLDKLRGLDLKDIESIEVINKRYSDTTTLSIEIDYINKPRIGYGN